MNKPIQFTFVVLFWFTILSISYIYLLVQLKIYDPQFFIFALICFQHGAKYVAFNILIVDFCIKNYFYKKQYWFYVIKIQNSTKICRIGQNLKPWSKKEVFLSGLCLFLLRSGLQSRTFCVYIYICHSPWYVICFTYQRTLDKSKKKIM